MSFFGLALSLSYILGLLTLTSLKINRMINKPYELLVGVYLVIGVGLALYFSVSEPGRSGYFFLLALWVLLFGTFLLSYRFVQWLSMVLVLTWLSAKGIQGMMLDNDSLYLVSMVITVNALNLLITEQIEGFYKRAYKEFNKCQIYSSELRKQRDLLEIRVRERTEQLEESRKADILKLNQMATLGKLSAGLTHEIVNPLTYIKFNLDLVTSGEKSNQYIQKAIKGVNQIDLLLQSFRKQLLDTKDSGLFNARKEIEGALALVHYRAMQSRVNIETDISSARLCGPGVKFNQIIVNMLTNAIDACENSFRKEIRIDSFKENDSYVLLFEDSGQGIRPEDRSRIFEPLYTTKDIDKGTGLGLSICKHIIEDDFGGSIKLKSAQKPTVFEITLPLP